MVEQRQRVFAGEVLPLQQNVRPAALHGLHKLLDEGVVLRPAHAIVLPAYIDGIVEQRLVVGAHVEQNRQAVLGRNAAQRCVESHFANGNAHAAGALVAEAEDALAVGDDDAAHVVVARVGQHLVHAVAVGIADEETARLAPDFAEALAALAHRGRVHHGQHLFHVVRDERIEERLRAVLQVAHEAVFVERAALGVEGLDAALALLVERADVRRQQSVEREDVALVLSECGAFVQPWVRQQLVAGEPGTNHPALRR